MLEKKKKKNQTTYADSRDVWENERSDIAWVIYDV